MKTFSIHVISLIFTWGVMDISEFRQLFQWLLENHWYLQILTLFPVFLIVWPLHKFFTQIILLLVSSIYVDSWTSNLSEIDSTVSCVSKYQSSIMRSFSRIVCNLPPVRCLLWNIGKFSTYNKIHPNVSLDTLKCLLNCWGKYPGITLSTYPSILLISPLTLRKLAWNPDN